MHAVIFANGYLTQPPEIDDSDLVIAADGGALHCLNIGITPHIVVGDMDSLSDENLQCLLSSGSEIIRHPARKDFSDLELALQLAIERGADDILILAALGARWDQSLANLLLPTKTEFANTRIRLIDGLHEIHYIHSGETLDISGSPGDTVSIIPLTGDVHGICTDGLEYSLEDGSLFFGSTRGISNVLLTRRATIFVYEGQLICIVIHQEDG